VRNDSHKRDHPIDPDTILLDARKRLAQQVKGDYDELWRFRFGSAKRLWGVKIGDVFYAVWWDPLHKVCPSK